MGSSTDQPLPNLSLPSEGNNDTNDASWVAVNNKDGEIYAIHEDDRVSTNITNQPHFNLAYRDIIIENALNPTITRVNEDHVALYEFLEGPKKLSVSEVDQTEGYLEDKLWPHTGFIELEKDDISDSERLTLKIGSQVLTAYGAYNGSNMDQLADGSQYKKLRSVDGNHQATNQSYADESITPDKMIIDIADGVNGFTVGNNKFYGTNASGTWGFYDPVAQSALSDTYMQSSLDLADLNSATIARSNLGLGNSATRNVGTTAGTVAAGNHGHSTLPTTDQKAAMDGAVGASASNPFLLESDSGIVTEISSRTTMGVWTLTGLSINKPVYLVMSSPAFGSYYITFAITSGSAHNDGVTDEQYLLGRTGGYVSSNTAIAIPTASTMVIGIGTLIAGATIRAFQ